MDICDYLYSHMIGTSTVEANCVNFEDMSTTARATRDAYDKALYEYIKNVIPCVIGETCESIIQEKVFIDFYQGSFIDFRSKFATFWNMFECVPITGIENRTQTVPKINGESEDIDYVVDFGDGTFKKSIVEEYQESATKFMCDVKNIMVLLMGETFDDSTFTEFYHIGGSTPTTTTTTTIAPTTTTTTTIPPTTTTTTTINPCSCVGGEITIGIQTWACKNSEITKYNDGTDIPEVTDPTTWASLTTGAWCYYNDDPANGPIYGKLYNWYAVAGIYDAASLSDPLLRKQFAPSGYHVPTFNDMSYLISNTLGGVSIAGRQMKEVGTTHWSSPNDATNSSCFTALGTGIRWTSGNYVQLNTSSYWWSSTSTYVDYGTSMSVYNSASSVSLTNSTDRNYGFSVRFIKD